MHPDLNWIWQSCGFLFTNSNRFEAIVQKPCAIGCMQSPLTQPDHVWNEVAGNWAGPTSTCGFLELLLSHLPKVAPQSRHGCAPSPDLSRSGCRWSPCCGEGYGEVNINICNDHMRNESQPYLINICIYNYIIWLIFHSFLGWFMWLILRGPQLRESNCQAKSFFPLQTQSTESLQIGMGTSHCYQATPNMCWLTPPVQPIPTKESK
jgi:hypothetical protein